MFMILFYKQTTEYMVKVILNTSRIPVKTFERSQQHASSYGLDYAANDIGSLRVTKISLIPG